MSGGSLDYLYDDVSRLAVKLSHAQRTLNDAAKTSNPDVRKRLGALAAWLDDAIDELNRVERPLHDAEWFMSGDYSEDTLLKHSWKWYKEA